MKYKKKPVIVEAMQYTGNNFVDIVNWSKQVSSERYIEEESNKDKSILRIETLEGIMTAQVNDFIIKGVKNEFYSCKPDIFEQTYELVKE